MSSNDNLRKYCRICLYTGIGMYVLFFFVQAMGLAFNLQNPDPDTITRWMNSLALTKPVIYLSALLFATGIALLAKIKGYNLVVSILGFIFANSLIGAFVIILLPDKNKQATTNES